MATLATLTIDLIGQSAKLRSELHRANKSTKDWAKRTRQQVNSTVKFMAGAGAAGAAALTAIYTSAAKEADKLAKTADKLGIDPEKLTGLQHAAELTGVSVDTANMALQRMVRRVAEAAQGTGEAKDALRELNLNAGQLAQLSPDQQFKAIADAMGNVAGQGDKVRLAMKLFDSEGVALVNTLALGKEGLTAMDAEAVALGITLTRFDLAKVEVANDAFHRAKVSTSSFGKALATEAAPLVKAVSDQFIQSAINAGGFGNVAKSVLDKVTTAVGFVADALHGLSLIWEGIKVAALSMVEGVLSGLAWLDRGVQALLGRFGTGVNDELQLLSSTFSDSGSKARQEYSDALLAPLPSEKIKTFVEDAKTKMDVAANEIASNSALLSTGNIETGDVTGTDELNAEFERVRNSLVSEEQLIAESYARRRQIIIDNTVANSDKQQTLLTELNEKTATQFFQHESNIGNIQAQAALERLKVSKLAGDLQTKHELNRLKTMTAGVAQSSKTMFKINKALSIASILVSTPRAVAGAYAAGAEIGGPILGAAYAAIAAAAQLAQLQQARSATFTGGGRGTTPSSIGTVPVINDRPAPVQNNPPISGGQDQVSGGITFIFNGDVNSNDAERLLEDIGRLINDGDHILIESGSRNAQELVAA